MDQPSHQKSGQQRDAVALPLQDWIQRGRVSLSKEDYLVCAVTVALELSYRMCLVMGENSPNFCSWSDSGDICFDLLATSDDEGVAVNSSHSSSSLAVRIEDIVPENVVIIAANDIAHDGPRAGFMATAVDIQPANRTPREQSKPPKLLSRDVCFALGNILFELFSQGDPLLLIDFDSDAESGDLFSDWLLGDADLNGNDEAPPPSKRSSSSSAVGNSSPPTSTKAKFFLQEQGLPLSVCQLISDLLENKSGNEFISDTALRSLEEARLDLLRMKTHPQRFLHDHTSPEKALDDTALFNQVDDKLYGRDREMSAIMDIVGRVTLHQELHAPPHHSANDEEQPTGVSKAGNFLCEVAFISGHSGSGKSSVIRQLVSLCDSNDWCVLFCKFDRQVAPLSALLNSVDSFFGKLVAPTQVDGGDFCRESREPAVHEKLDRISRSILSSIDRESLAQLCVLLPNLRKLVPMPTGSADREDKQSRLRDDSLADLLSEANNGPYTGAMGSGRNRLNYLFHLIFRSLCSAGLSVLICLEDMHWGDVATLDIVGKFLLAAGYDTVNSADGQSLQGGLIYAGTFRDNEVDDDGPVTKQIKCMEQSKGNINVNMVAIGELPEDDVNKMISFKLCLPMRHTRELARLVYQKTRGHPMFTIEFLRSIIKRNIMAFSIRDRRWVWDIALIESQLISDGVVELLTKKLKQLPDDVIRALTVMSCFGSQISLSTIQLLDLGQFVPDLMIAVDVAVKEGIVQKTGPSLAFSHDMLQETSYKLIPIHERRLLHKNIALSLVQDPEVDTNSELCILAVDQVNLCKDSDGILNPAEKAQFARLNFAAGKHCIVTSSYEQARTYFEAGISLLHANHWDKQYSLSLQLYEWSVIVSFMDGKIGGVSSRLDDILSHAKSFDDKLHARAMLAQFLASQERYAHGFKDVIDLLSDLGEVFPKKIDQAHLSSEIAATLPLLNDITEERIRNLPVMASDQKINAMKFLDLLITFSNFHSPMTLYVASCRMIQLTFQFGFCEDYTITGLVTFSHGLWLHSDSIDTSKRINRIATALITGNPKEHSLRAKLTVMITGINGIVEPVPAVAENILNGYKSATIVGDIDNAMFCGLLYCIALFYCPAELIDLRRNIVFFLREMAKHKQNGFLNSTMTLFNACNALIGNEDSCKLYAGIEMKSNSELYQIAEQTQNHYLMHHLHYTQTCVHCYFREYFKVAELAEKYQMTQVEKRALDICIVFYEGISALVLARETKQGKWRTIGEKSIKTMRQFAECSIWNFENKLLLLQAQLHCLNGRQLMAEISFQASIVSACEHRQVSEEALARELFGMNLVENKKFADGNWQLTKAVEKYKQLGAMKKADDVQKWKVNYNKNLQSN